MKSSIGYLINLSLKNEIISQKMKLNGTSLLLTITVLLCVSIIYATILQMRFLQKKVEDRYWFSDRVSFFQLVTLKDKKLQEIFSNAQGKIKIALTDKDSLEYESALFGVFERERLEFSCKHEKRRICRLVGTNLPLDTSLFITDHGILQYFSDSVYIEGEIYASKGKVLGTVPLTTNHQSKKVRVSMQNPDLNTQLTYKKSIEHSIEYSHLKDTLIDFKNYINRGYWMKTETIIADKIDVSNCSLAGNFKVLSRKIVIDKSAKINGGVFMADTIEVLNDFVGNTQLIARKFLKVGARSKLTYPSAVVLLANEISKFGDYSKLILSEYAKVDGVLLDLSIPTKGDNIISQTIIKNECMIRGLVYVCGMLSINAKVNGTVFANRLFSELGGEIQLDALPACRISKENCRWLGIPHVLRKNSNKITLCRLD